MNPGTRVIWQEFPKGGRTFTGYLIARWDMTALVRCTDRVRQAVYTDLKEI